MKLIRLKHEYIIHTYLHSFYLNKYNQLPRDQRRGQHILSYQNKITIASKQEDFNIIQVTVTYLI